VTDTDASREDVVGGRRRQAVDRRDSRVARRVGARSVLVHTDQVDVRALRQEVVRTERVLEVLRTALARAVRQRGAVAVREVEREASQQSRRELVLDVGFDVVERRVRTGLELRRSGRAEVAEADVRVRQAERRCAERVCPRR